MPVNRNKYNTRGKISNSPTGYGHLTEKGYIRIWDTEQKRYRMEHDVIWEQHYGKIPNEMQIHHKDGNKTNNNIENLELVDALQHKREHSGCIIIEGIEYKPCRKCGEYRPIDDYYKRESGISPWCKSCCVKNAVENKRKRKGKKNDTIKRAI